MCTVFMELDNSSRLMAKNFDCIVEHGMIFTNNRGIKKKSLVMPPQKEFVWTSFYGSVTFSQSGKGMPVCGINEMGLIVEQATLFETIYPLNDEQGELSPIEAIQYILDTCATVKMAQQAFQTLHISNHSAKLHYYLTDSSGDRMILEFLEGKMECYPKSEKLIPILTNSKYEETCMGKKQYLSDYEENSFHRFNVVERKLNTQLETGGKLTIYGAFDILKIAEQKSTVWSVVYDPLNFTIYVRCKDNQIKKLDLTGLDFGENAESYLFDLEKESEFCWEKYTRSMNRKNIQKFYENEQVLNLMQLTNADFVIQAIDEHENQIEQRNV